MPVFLIALSLSSLVLSGAIFGFFYAWFCCVMWGLDAAEPSVAIAAMQSMNSAVRNAAFAPAFFGTPLVLLGTALVSFKAGLGKSGLGLLMAAVVYAGGAFLPTVLINVPLNEELAIVNLDEITGSVETIWRSYSGHWQFWNGARTIASAICLILTGTGLLFLNQNTTAETAR